MVKDPDKDNHEQDPSDATAVDNRKSVPIEDGKTESQNAPEIPAPEAHAGHPNWAEAWAEADKHKPAWGLLSGDQSRGGSNTNTQEPERRKPQPATVAMLICTRGEDQGKQFPLVADEVMIGRTSSNTIVLKDGSVSREHARFLWNNGYYILYDLQSGNGTFVNGQKITREKVYHHDQIVFGRAAFRLEIPASTVRRPVMHAFNARNLMLHPWVKIGLAAAFVLVIAAAVVSYALLRSGNDHSRTQDLAFSHYLQGLDAFKAHHWDVAERHFKISLEVDPSFDLSKNYLRAIQHEREAEQGIAQAKLSQGSGNLKVAYETAQATLGSIYHDDARTILSDIEAKISDHITRASEAMRTGKTQEAYRNVEWLTQVAPNRQDVMLLKAELQERTSPKEPKEKLNIQLAQPTLSQPVKVEPKAPDDKPNDAPSLQQAKNFLRQGDLENAIYTLQSGGESTKGALNKLLELQESYHDGIELHRAKKPQSAIPLLAAARVTLLGFVGTDSPLYLDINHKLADMYYVQGIEHLLNDDFPPAYRDFSTALQYNSQSDAVVHKLQELADKAQELMQEGDRLLPRNEDEARARYRIASQIIGTKNPLHKQLQERLKER